MQETVGEVGMSSLVMYFYGPATLSQAKAGQLARTYL